MKRAPTSDIIWLFVVTRLLLVLATYVAFILFPVPPHVYKVNPVNMTALLTSWDRWDAANYTRIAQFGYQTVRDTAFFPLFPLLINIISLPFGHHGYLAIGMFLSNLAFLGVLFILYQLATDILGEQVGRHTLLYLSLFPTAFFFFAAYNESLFVLFTAGAFLAMRRQKWWLAGILGLLASLTRAAGLFLVIPYLYEFWISRGSLTAVDQGTWRKLLSMVPKLLPIILIPLGTTLYCIYCWKLFGDPFAFATVQQDWARHLSWPWQGLAQAIFELFRVLPFASFYEVHTILDLSATIGFITLAVLGWRRLRTSYSLWLAILLLYMLLSPATTQHDALQSNQRFVLEMFPGFITLAALGIKHPRLHQGLIIAFPFLQAILASLFVLNRWMV